MTQDSYPLCARLITDGGRRAQPFSKTRSKPRTPAMGNYSSCEPCCEPNHPNGLGMQGVIATPCCEPNHPNGFGVQGVIATPQAPRVNFDHGVKFPPQDLSAAEPPAFSSSIPSGTLVSCNVMRSPSPWRTMHAHVYTFGPKCASRVSALAD